MRATLEFLTERSEVSHTAQGWEPLVPLTELASDTPPSLTSAIEARIEGLTDEEIRLLEEHDPHPELFDRLLRGIPLLATPRAEEEFLTSAQSRSTANLCPFAQACVERLPGTQQVRAGFANRWVDNSLERCYRMLSCRFQQTVAPAKIAAESARLSLLTVPEAMQKQTTKT